MRLLEDVEEGDRVVQGELQAREEQGERRAREDGGPAGRGERIESSKP